MHNRSCCQSSSVGRDRLTPLVGVYGEGFQSRCKKYLNLTLTAGILTVFIYTWGRIVSEVNCIIQLISCFFSLLCTYVFADIKAVRRRWTGLNSRSQYTWATRAVHFLTGRPLGQDISSARFVGCLFYCKKSFYCSYTVFISGETWVGQQGVHLLQLHHQTWLQGYDIHAPTYSAVRSAGLYTWRAARG